MSRYRRIIDTFRNDSKFLDPQVPLTDHKRLEDLISEFLKAPSLRNQGDSHRKLRVLEIGSREVTGKSDAREKFADCEYQGFDIIAGPNVDVVGDAHQLLSYFPNQKFDFIFSSAVFEHLAMPWVVTPQIASLLTVGGMVSIQTHFSYSSHERPWHFFQFSDMALRALFPPPLGIECIEAGASNPLVGYFSALAEDRLRDQRVRGLYCHSDFLGRKVREVDNFNWGKVITEDVVSKTHYPAPKIEP